MSRLFFDYSVEREREELVSTAIVALGSIAAACSVIVALIAGPLAMILLGDSGQGGILFLGVVGLLLNVIFTLGLQYLTALQSSTAVLTVSTYVPWPIWASACSLSRGSAWESSEHSSPS